MFLRISEVKHITYNFKKTKLIEMVFNFIFRFTLSMLSIESHLVAIIFNAHVW